MTDRRVAVLTDAWIPLDQGGREQLVSFVDLLSGEADAPDLLHPREDLRFFARMLLAALVQALFEPRDERELAWRIQTPMPRGEVLARVAEVAEDFWLVHEEERRGFLQTGRPPPEKKTPGRGPAPGAFDSLSESHLLYRRRVDGDAICVVCAMTSLFGLQCAARAGGRGWVASIRKGAPVATMVAVGKLGARSVRVDTWANVLAAGRHARLGLVPAGARPWVQTHASVPGADYGFSAAEGSLWQPRTARILPAPAGDCPLCGRIGTPRFVVSDYDTSLTSAKGDGAFFPHPLAPTRAPGKLVQLRANRPFWTSFGELLPSLQGTASDEGRAAPVVQQALEPLVGIVRRWGLRVFEIGTDKASLVHVLHESLGLPLDLDGAHRARARELVEAADEVRLWLLSSLVPSDAKMRDAAAIPSRLRKRELADVEATFWQRTQAPFYESLRSPRDAAAVPPFRRALRSVALDLFDDHVAPYRDDPRSGLRVARAKRSLARKLATFVGPDEDSALPSAVEV